MNARNLVWVALASLSIVTACNYTVGDCYPVGQADGPAGVGESGVGVGVGGVGGYGFGDAPKSGGTGANACNASDDPSSTPPDEGSQPPNEGGRPPDEGGPPPDEGTELGTYIRCRGLDWITCEGLCLDIGAQCSALALNPQKPELGVGKLKQCMRNLTSSTCTYCFENGMTCTQIKAFGVSIRWWCTYTNGKGCE